MRTYEPDARTRITHVSCLGVGGDARRMLALDFDWREIDKLTLGLKNVLILYKPCIAGINYLMTDVIYRLVSLWTTVKRIILDVSHAEP